MMPRQNAITNYKQQLKNMIEHRYFTTVIMTLILINAIIVGLETYPSLHEQFHDVFYAADRILLWLFTLEILVRMFAARPFHSYFKDSWNIFDFVIVLSSHLFVGASFVTVLRILRVLRLLRTISVIPSLRRIVNALLLTIPALGNIMLLLSLLFYIFAVLGTMLFGSTLPEYFGTLHTTLLTLFQVITLESWASGVMRPLLEAIPWSWAYFVSFILIGSFVVINLFIGVIVSNVEKANEEELEEVAAKEDQIDMNVKSVNHEIMMLRNEVRELKELLLAKTNHEKERETSES